MKLGEERKQALCLFILKGRRLDSTVLEILNLASLLNTQVVMSKQLNFSSLEFNLKTNAEDPLQTNVIEAIGWHEPT